MFSCPVETTERSPLSGQFSIKSTSPTCNAASGDIVYTAAGGDLHAKGAAGMTDGGSHDSARGDGDTGKSEGTEVDVYVCPSQSSGDVGTLKPDGVYQMTGWKTPGTAPRSSLQS